jgi:hypothetical protein
MIDIPCCEECGVPIQVIDGHRWLDSGVIILLFDPTLRMAFVECENFDPMFEGIEKTIGMPIEHLLIDIERKGTRDYFAPTFTEEVRAQVERHEIPLEPFIEAGTTTNRVNGLGRHEPVGYRHELENHDNDYITTRCYGPYSLPLACGDLAGATEAMIDREYGDVSHIELSPGVYEITAAVSGIPKGLVGRMERKKYKHREGDIKLATCSTCGGPAALSEFKWDLEKGVIRSTVNGRRVGIFHPSLLDPLFEELKRELGEAIPEAVIDAQRLFVKNGSYSPAEIGKEERFREQLALRGIGNLRKLEKSAAGLSMRLDNVCLHLIVVGTLQGLFEMESGRDSRVEWELSGEGDLDLEVITTA